MKKKPGDAAAKGAKNISSGAGAAAGKAAGKMSGSSAGKAAKSMLAGAMGAAGKAAGGAGGKIASAAGKIGAMGAAGATRKPKPQAGTGRPSPRPPHGRRRDGGSIGGGNVKKPKVDLTGKTKAQIMALKRLGKI